MATKKSAKKSSKTAKRATGRTKTAVRFALTQKVEDVLKSVCESLKSASQALEVLRQAQTDESLKQKLSVEITSLESGRALAEAALSKGVGEGVQGVGK